MGKDNLVEEVIMEKKKKENIKTEDLERLSKEGKDTTATTGKGGGLRFNKGKLRYDLVEPRAHRDMVEILTMGANKYFDRNWENGLSWTSVIASLKRHLDAIERGEDYDPESGKLHIAHVACNVHFLNTFYYTFPQGDDRPKRFLNTPAIGLDIDGVIADFTHAWNEVYPEIPADPNSYFFDRQIMQRFENMRKAGTLDDFYLNLKPLIKPEDLPFEPKCYVTARPVDTKITEQWIDANGFPKRKVITVPTGTSKVEVMKTAGIEIFIDDFYDNFVELNKAGIFTYLYTRPWNTRYDVGHMRLNSLKDIPLLQQ
jgi:hypothetical protein